MPSWAQQMHLMILTYLNCTICCTWTTLPYPNLLATISYPMKQVHGTCTHVQRYELRPGTRPGRRCVGPRGPTRLVLTWPNSKRTWTSIWDGRDGQQDLATDGVRSTCRSITEAAFKCWRAELRNSPVSFLL